MTNYTNPAPAPFMKINAASKTTGLSTYYLRTGCRNNTVPHIMSGKTYFINVPALLRQLNAEQEH